MIKGELWKNEKEVIVRVVWKGEGHDPGEESI